MIIYIFNSTLLIEDNLPLMQQKIFGLKLFSLNDKYFALIDCQDYKLKIRKQLTLEIAQQFKVKRIIRMIKFHHSFKYCVMYDELDLFYFYILMNNKQFRLI